MLNTRFGLLGRPIGRAILAVVFAIGGGNACHGTDSGSTVASPNVGGSGGMDGGAVLNVDDNDAAAAGQAGAVGAGECTELAGLGKCGSTTVQAQYDTANILLVIDKSGSMTDQPAGFGVNKWEALKTALDSALNNVVGRINFGLVLYPFTSDHQIPLVCDQDCCEVATGTAAVNVPIESGQSGVSKILDALNATAPGGGTPTAA